MSVEYVFETARMRCRRWMRSDQQPLLAVYGDAEAMRWVGDGEPLSLAGCEEWLVVTANNYRRRGYGMFALEDKGSGQVVGFCGLVHPGGQPEAEVKYAFLRSRWGCGLATEAVTALIAYGAAVHGLTRVIATVAPANHASARVLNKAGLRKSQTRRNDDGTLTDVFEWSASDTGGPMMQESRSRSRTRPD